jgi:hypothetical protein
MILREALRSAKMHNRNENTFFHTTLADWPPNYSQRALRIQNRSRNSEYMKSCQKTGTTNLGKWTQNKITIISCRKFQLLRYAPSKLCDARARRVLIGRIFTVDGWCSEQAAFLSFFFTIRASLRNFEVLIFSNKFVKLCDIKMLKLNLMIRLFN